MKHNVNFVMHAFPIISYNTYFINYTLQMTCQGSRSLQKIA